MNLALIRAKYDPFGGAERFVQTAVEALSDAGVSLTILTRQWPAQANPAIAHVTLDPTYFTSTGRDRTFANAVRQHLGNTHYDLVQSHERIAGCDVYRAGDGVHAEWLAQRARVQGGFARWTTRINPHHRYLLDAERAMFTSPRLKAVICNSAMVRDEIVQRFAIDPTKLHVIHSGVDSEKFSPTNRALFRDATRRQHNITASARVALFVGSGFERKGLAAFLKSISACTEVHAIVVGKDKHLARYEALAQSLGIAQRVVFTGGVNDVRPYYAVADVFVLPTLYDPLPNACLEAMACGLPVITSSKSGAAELIVDGENGWVTDALDVSAIASAIKTALDNARVGGRARERVLPLTPAAMAAQYLALYRRLLGVAPAGNT